MEKLPIVCLRGVTKRFDEVVAVELGGGVTQYGERKLVRRHALAVVGHADEGEAAARDGDLDAARAGERVPAERRRIARRARR